MPLLTSFTIRVIIILEVLR